MAEGLAKRVGRIISGSVNAMVNAIEETAPEMIMQEATREIDNAIADVRSELGKVIAAKHLANKQLAEKNTKHEEFSEKIQVALSEGRDDLVEAAISAQLDIEAQIPVLEHTIAECGEREKELESYITALQAKMREMEQELVAYREAVKSSSEDVVAEVGNSSGQSQVNKTVDQAISAFDRILEKQTGLGVDNSIDHQNTAKLAELEKLTRENRIKERLAVLKSNNEGT